MRGRHPPSHEVAQHIKPGLLQQVGDSLGRSCVARSPPVLSPSRTRTYVCILARIQRHAHLHTHLAHATPAAHTHPHLAAVCKHARMCWLAFQPCGWMGVWAWWSWALSGRHESRYQVRQAAHSMRRYCIVWAKSQAECSAVTDSPNACTGPTGSAIPQLATEPPSLVFNSSVGAGGALLGLITPWVSVGSVWRLGATWPGIGH